MIRSRRAARLVACLAAVTLAASACGTGGSGGDSQSKGVPGADALTSAKGVTTITFWHSMKASNADALNTMVDAFNTKNAGKIKVNAVFQGEYDDVITKYKASVQQKQTPDLAQVYDIGTRFMVDSKQTVAAGDFAAKDKYDLSALEPNITNYYTLDGKLRSMPLNSSLPLLYINVEAFKKAGLDPNKPPQSLYEIMTAAKKLTVKNAGGQVTQYGFGASIYGWFLEQLIAQSGETYCNLDNGRKGLATEVQFGGATGTQVATWWADMVKQGLATNTGRKTDDAQAAFKSGKVAMNLESTGALRGYLKAADGKFTLATAPFPKADTSSAGASATTRPTGGPIIGGASLWISGPGHSDAQQRAAWEFTKFATSAEQQAIWHTSTGYFPVNKGALDLPVDKAWVAKYPQFSTAITVLHSEKPSMATAGCALGTMPQSRKAAEDGLEKAILGSATPSTAMSEAAKGMTPTLQQYNSSVSGN
jgi:sn-glycerol 3-phosphate transport system substrate-binding protein